MKIPREGKNCGFRCRKRLTTFIVTVIPIPNPLIVEEPLTSCVIGGLMYGVGVGLCLYAGGSGGGTDILGIYFSKRYRNFSVGKVNIIINGTIYLVCALMFDLQTAIYCIIYAALSSFAVDRAHSQNIMIQVTMEVRGSSTISGFGIGMTVTIKVVSATDIAVFKKKRWLTPL
mgnify:CR=1 FL=1